MTSSDFLVFVFVEVKSMLLMGEYGVSFLKEGTTH